MLYYKRHFIVPKRSSVPSFPHIRHIPSPLPPLYYSWNVFSFHRPQLFLSDWAADLCFCLVVWRGIRVINECNLVLRGVVLLLLKANCSSERAIVDWIPNDQWWWQNQIFHPGKTRFEPAAPRTCDDDSTTVTPSCLCWKCYTHHGVQISVRMPLVMEILFIVLVIGKTDLKDTISSFLYCRSVLLSVTCLT